MKLAQIGRRHLADKFNWETTIISQFPKWYKQRKRRKLCLNSKLTVQVQNVTKLLLQVKFSEEKQVLVTFFNTKTVQEKEKSSKCVKFLDLITN